jgi:ribosomal protein S18 acetylase RimI-like enzyme
VSALSSTQPSAGVIVTIQDRRVFPGDITGTVTETFTESYTETVTKTGQALWLRQAQADEKTLVRELDDEIFPANDDALERAEPGELERAADLGDVVLLERDGVPVGYVHMDTTHRDRYVYISGFGIRPAEQGKGLGTQMIDLLFERFADLRTDVPWFTVTSPLNYLMLRILFHRDFGGRWFMPDFFGPGRHRLGCQLRTPGSRPATTGLSWESVRDFSALRRGLDRGEIIQAYGDRDGDFFVLGPQRPEDFLDCPSPFELLHLTDK